MDFLDPAKKRSHNRRLLIGYLLVGTAILMSSIILIFLIKGYDLDRKTGEVIQNGLIFTDSSPEATRIYLNGKDNGETSKRLTVPAGAYEVELRRNGYRSWNKTVQLEGSSMERLIYPKLFPNDIKQAASARYEEPVGFSTQSPDRRWLIISPAGGLTSFQVFDMNSTEKAPANFSIPEGLLTPAPEGATSSIEFVEWASDNRHLLVKHVYGESYEFIVLDRESGGNTLNVNKELGVSPTSIALRDKKFDHLYLYDQATRIVSYGEIKTKQIIPVITDVVDFKPYGNKMILYSSSDANLPGKTIVRLWEDGKTYVLHTYDETKVLLDLAEFDGSWYVAVIPVSQNRMHIYKDPFKVIKEKSATEAKPFAALRIDDAKFVSFSANTRFVAAQSGDRFSIYDFETGRRHLFEAEGEIPATQQARWMDGHRLVLNQDNKVVLFEFDGANRQTLVDISSGTLPFFNRDYDRLYTLSPTGDSSEAGANRVTLLRSSLKLNLEP